jgi:hypothetical protein
MTYLALVQDIEWCLDREDLIRALRADRPAAEVDDAPDQVTWADGAGADRVWGSAHESGQCIYLDGPDRPVAEFVVWFRGLVPAGREVVFCDDSYSFDAVVQPGDDVEQVLALLPY